MVQYYEDYILNDNERLEFDYKKYIDYYIELCSSI